MKIIFTGNLVLDVVNEAGYRHYKLTNNNLPPCYVSGHSYKFNKNIILSIPIGQFENATLLKQLSGQRFSLPKEVNESYTFLIENGFCKWLNVCYGYDVSIIEVFE